MMLERCLLAFSVRAARRTLLSMKMKSLPAVFLMASIAASAASDERTSRVRVCDVQAHWAASVFDLIEENPRVILSGMDAQDDNAFTFIRNWIKDGKSRDDLRLYVIGHCMGRAT